MKKWKIIVSIVVLIIAVGAGSIYYLLKIKDYETTDTKVDEIVEGNFDIKLPEGASNESSGQPSADDGTDSQPEKSVTTTLDSTSGTETDTGTDTTVSKVTDDGKNTNKEQKETVTAASIIEKYQPSFRDLENQAIGKLDALLSYALIEYNSQKEKGEDISYIYYYTKYNAAAKKLEAGADATFTYIYDELVKDLKKSGYDDSEAQAIKNQYASMKKERRSVLITKAKAYINI